MKHLIFLTLLTLFSNATNNDDNNSMTEDNLSVETSESFLSSVEYGKMLYKNPRGISCSQCHGKTGKGGQVIAKFYDKKKNPKLLKGVDITSYSLKDLTASLKNEYRENNKRKPHKIMPMYYLTTEEIQAIFDYLQYSNKQKD
ncbi:MAG: Putative periplasmic protein [uncultured Sulfurovum sp.]|uniref:Periplasmic protein n=1 Tax=uncultured Sulfurovum sp. TaxID=269237 RepID=A0A6S6S790_9BACT|nr:MAG: Putative periplasmic protein [uncultured Sulfurovum sp.]